MSTKARDARARLQAAPKPPSQSAARKQGVVLPISSARVLFVNGPNANLYGHAGQATYGSETFEQLGERCRRAAEASAIALDFRQSNSEGEVVDAIQQAIGTRDGIIINGAGLTYTSIAVLDALQAFPGPIVEVHMSNIYRREPFRHFSYISRVATGIVAGLGADGYEMAVLAMRRLLDRPKA
jgi:3-dehydroquinate dehydratase-2